METDGESWLEYIVLRFKDTSLYTVTEMYNTISVTSPDTGIKTTLLFVFSADFIELTDILFYSKLTQATSSYSGGVPIKYSYQELTWIEDNWINIPLEKGWKEKEFFFASKTAYKTQVFYDKTSNKSDFTQWNGWFSNLLAILSFGGLFAIKGEFIVPPILPDS